MWRHVWPRHEHTNVTGRILQGKIIAPLGKR